MITRNLKPHKADKGHSTVQIDEEYRDGFLRLFRATCQCGTKIGTTRGDRDGVIRRAVAHTKAAIIEDARLLAEHHAEQNREWWA